jgi:hypothetical protein
LPLAQEAAGKFCSNVLRIGCRSPIPGNEQLAARGQ